MVNMVNAEQLSRLSPVQRVQNSYESLYFGTPSGDRVTDGVVRKELSSSFLRNDVVFEDPDVTPDAIRHAYLDAYVTSVGVLQGTPVTDEQRIDMQYRYERFEKEQHNVQSKTYDGYRAKYEETLDFDAYMAAVMPELMETEYNAEEPDLDAQALDMGPVAPQAAISYGHAVSTPTPVVPLTYEAHRNATRDLDEMKGDHDTDYDAYKRGREDNASDFTAGDGYGFDEREDDGPEL